MASNSSSVLSGLSAAFPSNFTDMLDGHWQSVVIEFAHKHWNVAADLIARNLFEKMTTEVVACGLSAGGALWLLKRFVLRNPRLVMSFVATWIAWFVGDMSIGRGTVESWKDIQQRGVQTFDASRDLAKSLVKFVTAWLHFLMPFLVDAFHLGRTLWNQLTPHQRLLLFFAVLALYAAIETFRHARSAVRSARNKAKGAQGALKKVMFQASFLALGPLLWFASGLVPLEWLPWLVSGAVSLTPSLFSYGVACQCLADNEDDDVPSQPQKLRSLSRLPRLPLTQGERRKMWLSYWACWPLLKAAELGMTWLPWLIPGYSTSGYLPTSDLQRAMLVLVTWLQFWQGSRLLNFTLRSTLGRFNGVVITIPIGKLRKKAQQASAGELQPSMRTMGRIARLTSKLPNLGRYRNLWKVGLGALLIGFAVLAWLFYRAFRLLSDILTVMTWCFAAADTADLLFKGAEDFYTKRLSFWVLAMVWDAMTRLPVFGSALSIFNPVVFSIFYIAGDKVIRWLLIPITSRLEAMLRALSKPLLSVMPSMPSLRRSTTAAGAATDEDEDDDDDETEAEAEALDDQPVDKANGKAHTEASIGDLVEKAEEEKVEEKADVEKADEMEKRSGIDRSDSRAPVTNLGETSDEKENGGADKAEGSGLRARKGKNGK